MIGSEKQIKWASDIKAKIETEAAQYKGKAEHYDKIIDFILSINDSRFWIDYRESDLRDLMTKLIKSALFVNGQDNSDCAKSDMAGVITYGNKGIDGIFVAK